MKAFAPYFRTTFFIFWADYFPGEVVELTKATIRKPGPCAGYAKQIQAGNSLLKFVTVHKRLPTVDGKEINESETYNKWILCRELHFFRDRIQPKLDELLNTVK